jgi:hypothetical protein
VDFSEAYERYAHDDVISEMLACLWQASSTYDPERPTTFGAYWWSLWLNRKTYYIRLWNAQKRVHPVLLGEHIVEAGEYAVRLLPEPPPDAPPEAVAIWVRLALGDERQDVLRDLGISKRRYYDILHSWRTDEVATTLRDS